MAEEDNKIRLDFPTEADPTAVRVPKVLMLGREHPSLGWLFAPDDGHPENLDAHELAEDELSRRRRRRFAA